MTMCASQAPRQNREGDACPPWCVTDHGKYGFHGSQLTSVPLPEYRYCRIRTIRSGMPGMPARTEIQLAETGLVSIRADEAADLAALIEHLAEATPDQHRELAAAIRKAAAGITEGGQ
jgi:hypothetical protein